jgi:Heavy metal binding domain
VEISIVFLFPQLCPMKRLHLLFLGLVLGAMLSSCGEKPAESSNPPAPGATMMQKLGPEYTAAYICPMYCEGSGSDKPGKCPVCGMDYRENKDAKPATGNPAKADSATDATHQH